MSESDRNKPRGRPRKRVRFTKLSVTVPPSQAEFLDKVSDTPSHAIQRCVDLAQHLEPELRERMDLARGTNADQTGAVRAYRSLLRWVRKVLRGDAVALAPTEPPAPPPATGEEIPALID